MMNRAHKGRNTGCGFPGAGGRFPLRSLPALLGAVLVLLLATACGQGPDQFMARARTAQDEGRWADAELELRNAGAQAPDCLPCRLALGRALWRQGKAAEAEERFREVLARRPGDPEAQVGLAELLAAAGKAEEALALCRSVLEREPGHARALMLEAFLRIEKGLNVQAVQDLERLRATLPNSPEAYSLLAEIQVRQGQYELAREILGQGLERLPKNELLTQRLVFLALAENRPEEAEQRLRDLAIIDPDRLDYRFSLVEFYRGRGQLAQAREVVEEILARRPENDHYRLALAGMDVSLKAYDRAEMIINEGLRLTPDSLPLRFAWADLAAMTGRHREATEELTALVEQGLGKPELLAAHRRLASLYLAAGDMARAMREVALVLEAAPGDADMHLVLGRMYLAQGKGDEAAASIQAAVQARPGNPALHRLLAQARLARRDRAGAVAALDRAIAIDPSYQPGWEGLLDVSLEFGDLPQALADLRRLRQMRPGDPRIGARIGDALLLLGDQKQAQEEYEALVAAFPKNPLGFLKLGQLALIRKQYPEASGLFDQALALAPKSVLAMEGKIAAHLARRWQSEALSFIRRRLEENPGSPFLLAQLGRVETARKLYPEAAEDLAKAQSLAPDWGVPALLQAALAVESGQVEAALARFAAALKATPDSLPVAFALGVLAEQDRQWDQARKFYEAILARRPDFAPAANNLAWLLATRFESPENLRKAVELGKVAARSGLPEAWDTLGVAQLALGQTGEALASLAQARVLKPDFPSAAFHAAKAHLKQGERDKARELLAEALKSEAEFPERGEAEKLLSAQ